MSTSASHSGGPLPAATIDAVLARLGLPGRPAPDLAGLRAVYRAWCTRLSFDNIEKLIHLRAGDPAPLPGATPADFFARFLAGGCGATCWAGAGALAALLEGLGFAPQRVVATMLVAPDLPPNHGSVLVPLHGTDWLVDTSMLTLEPLAVGPAPGAVDHPAWGVQARREDGRLHVRWQALHRDAPMDCRIDAVGVGVGEFMARHEATRGWSPFNYALTVNAIRGGRRLGIALGHRVDVDARGRLQRTPLDRAGRDRLLVDTLGIDPARVARLPDDIAMPPPPGSQSAARMLR